MLHEPYRQNFFINDQNKYTFVFLICAIIVLCLSNNLINTILLLISLISIRIIFLNFHEKMTLKEFVKDKTKFLNLKKNEESFEEDEPNESENNDEIEDIKSFTTSQQFDSAQSNVFNKEVENTEVRTWDDGYGPQGLGNVN
tara:strand:- start:64 stop:489 length:426 start_codon:yes stop_codon:yes gene_type:complete